MSHTTTVPNAIQVDTSDAKLEFEEYVDMYTSKSSKLKNRNNSELHRKYKLFLSKEGIPKRFEFDSSKQREFEGICALYDND